MLHGNKANKNVDNTSSNNFGMKEKRYLIKQKRKGKWEKKE